LEERQRFGGNQIQREQDLERELRSDLDLETEEQQENGLCRKKPAMPPGAPSAM
jgi:hypothetical protein